MLSIMSIRILYDNGGFQETHGGVSRYFTEMMRRLPKDCQWELGIAETSNIYLQQPPFNIPPYRQTVYDFVKNTLHGHSFKGVSHFYKLLARMMPWKFPSGELENERAIHKAYLCGDFDILHLTSPHPVKNTWRSVIGQKPIVVTVHDLIPEMLQGNKRVARCRAQLLREASHVIAVSENTKRDVVSLYGIPKEKISVIYHGYMPSKNTSSAMMDDIPWPYLLFVGKRAGYKNFRFFIEAVAPILREKGIGLFCTGSAFTDNEKTMLAKLGVEKKVMQRFVSDSELTALFANATAFVYPSVYEGFGIPILDAFNSGCPVILSNCSCFPEVAGDAALYFDKGDAVSLRTNVVELMKESVLRGELIDKGHKRLASFSWERCALEVSELYRQTLAEKV